MRLSFERHNIELKSWENKSEMLQFLENCDLGRVLLGQDAEQDKEFYSVLVRFNFSGLHCLGIGICSEGQGIIPHLLLLPKDNLLLFGFNRQVCAINLKTKNIEFQIKLDSLFSSFWEMQDIETILLFHEIGVIAINNKGKILWHSERDIIVDAIREGNDLQIYFIDQSSIRLNLLRSQKELQLF